MRLLSATVLLLCPALAEAQSRDEINRLAELGQVWGFLKYFHPGVNTGTINWDSALVATVPRVQAARSTADYNIVISSLLDAAGPVRSCSDACNARSPDSLRKNIDFRWLSGSKTLNRDLVRKLEFVRDNRHIGAGRYVRFTNTAVFQTDTAFSAPDYPEEGVRLLALFRFWNAARYYFPYMYVNGGDWNAVLPEFIPRLITARNAEEYQLTLVELAARINDAHVGAGSTVIAKALGSRNPSFEVRAVEGRIMVWKPARGLTALCCGLQVGDVITHVDSVPVELRRRAYTKYVAAGNPAVLERKLIGTVVRGGEDTVTYGIERAGKSLTLRVAMAPQVTATTPPALPVYPVTELVRVLPGNIGYINMGDITTQQVDSAIAIVKGTSGIVMDVRNYPRGTMYLFANFFNPKSVPFVKFTTFDSTYPGQVTWTPSYMAGRPNGNSDHYRGRVAILVDERTQSHAEFTVMALRTSPENKVIGSQTAGADGNITPFMLPGGVRTLFTGLGVYYPDGRQTQRIGIVPDIVIRPTLKGIREGRDEVLERALEYIRSGR